MRADDLSSVDLKNKAARWRQYYFFYYLKRSFTCPHAKNYVKEEGLQVFIASLKKISFVTFISFVLKYLYSNEEAYKLVTESFEI